MSGRSCVVALALTTAAATPARGQSQDLATCDADLPACTGEINDCCLRAFDPIATRRAVIIPMDRCHQRLAAAGDQAPPPATWPSWCGDPVSGADDGMFQAYGLVYRLMQHRINVHWLVNPSKDPPRLTADDPAQRASDRDIDLWVLGEGVAAPLAAGEPLAACSGHCADPVRRLEPASMLPIADSYNYRQLPVRGGAFVIAPEDRARFDAFMRRTGEFAALAESPSYDFSAVDIYELASGARLVAQDFRTSGPRHALYDGGAPVAQRIDAAAPRVALVADAAPTWLARAHLDAPAAYPACASGTFSPPDAVYCPLGADDLGTGALARGDFQSAWLEDWSDDISCAGGTAAVDAVRDFMTAVPGARAGGSVLARGGAIAALESATCGGAGFTTTSEEPREVFILRRPGNLLMQWGDLPTRFAPGAVASWHGAWPATRSLVRLVTRDRSAIGNATCSFHRSAPDCDVADDDEDLAAYFRYQDRDDNGVAVYLGGGHLAGADSAQRMVLNAILALPAAGRPASLARKEIMRSARITATVAGGVLQVQGSAAVTTTPTRVSTFSGAASASSFRFPATPGHLRAVRGGTSIALFDGADGIPAADPSGCSTSFRGTCRTVFTTIATPEDGLAARPPRVLLTTGNAAHLAPLMGAALGPADARALVARVLAGGLGGIDHSSPAVIEPSPLVPSAADRPTMIYVGAMDGMLHAFCAESKGPCPAAGRELWAFLPRTQLPSLRLNAARIDGSPKVSDVFGHFAAGEARGEWRTVLTFQTGSGSTSDPARAPAAFALDITDPAAPVVLWERTTPAARGEVAQGVGLGVAMGHARIAGQTTGLTFVQTRNGGTGAAGFWLGAVASATGELVWEVKHLYPAAAVPVPASGIPGGAVAIGTDATGMVTRVLVPSLRGALWQYAAATGKSPLGDGVPLIELGGDHHPVGVSPGVYRHIGNGRLYAIVASGAYVDPIAPTWAPAGTTQYLVSAAIDTSPAHAPITESGRDDASGDRGFVQVLDGERRPVATRSMSDDVVARGDH